MKFAWRSGDFYCSVVRLVYRELIQKFGRDDEIDDDVQMAFLSAYQKRGQLKEVKSLKRYVIQSALYIGERRRSREARMDVLGENAECQNKEADVPRLCLEGLAFEMVNRVLPHPDSDIVIMKAAYGYSEKEIAHFLRLGEDAVGYRYRRGIAKVKKSWGVDLAFDRLPSSKREARRVGKREKQMGSASKTPIVEDDISGRIRPAGEGKDGQEENRIARAEGKGGGGSRQRPGVVFRIHHRKAVGNRRKTKWKLVNR